MSNGSKPSTCRVAFVGAGYMTREHARAFGALPNVELVGIYSRGRPRAEAVARELQIGTVCESVADLHEKTRPHLVVVSVPELEMHRVASDCFAFPWAVLLEKPAGYDVADALRIIEVAGERAGRVMVALNRRSYAATQAALADLEAIPGPRYIRAQDQQDQATALKAGQPAKVVENWMYANSVHVIDYFSVFARGEAVRVEPLVRWDPAKPGLVLAKIEFSSGDIGLYEGIWNGPGPWAVTISTPQKRWELRPLEQAAYQDAGTRKLVPLGPDQVDVQFKAGLFAQAQKAVAAAMGGPLELPNLQEALKSMRLVERIFA